MNNNDMSTALRNQIETRDGALKMSVENARILFGAICVGY